MIDQEYRRSELSQGIKRNIKRKEQALGRVCRRIWSYTNHKGEQYLFGSFCVHYDRLIVTIGYYEARINRFYPSY